MCKRKIMKRHLILSVVTLLVAAACSAQVGFGVEAGLNFSQYNVQFTDGTKNNNLKLAGRYGLLSEFAISDNFYFQPGFFYATNGYKHNLQGGYEKYVINSVEVPLNIEYKIGELGNPRIFVGAGPYIAYNKAGFYKIHIDRKVDSRRDLRIGSGATDDFKRWDMGFGVNVGYQFIPALLVRARWQMGLNDQSTGFANNSAHLMTFGITAGYLFYLRERNGDIRINRQRDLR